MFGLQLVMLWRTHKNKMNAKTRVLIRWQNYFCLKRNFATDSQTCSKFCFPLSCFGKCELLFAVMQMVTKHTCNSCFIILILWKCTLEFIDHFFFLLIGLSLFEVYNRHLKSCFRNVLLMLVCCYGNGSRDLAYCIRWWPALHI